MNLSPAAMFRKRSTRAVEADLQNQHLLIQLRWIAMGGQVATIAFVATAMQVDLPLVWMAATLTALLVLNLVSLAALRRGRVPGAAWPLMIDAVLLTVQLGLSGGATNPFTALYLLQITLAAVLLRPRDCWIFIGLTAVLAGALTLLYLPLQLPGEETIFPIYLIGMLVALVIDAVLIAAFVTRINRNLRDRDARLADMRQQAAEEDHIVRMGLLASGAAHELGTPLALISVILSDWRTLMATRDDTDLQHDVAQMQKALDRCKGIVGEILRSSGETRGIAPGRSSVNAFLDDLVAEWTESRQTEALQFYNRIDDDLPILTDPSIKQLVTAVLDNALEASPDRIYLTAMQRDDALVLRIDDRGPGFDAGVLAKFGKPYNSTKPGEAKGVGLFLVVNAIHKLGGEVKAVNHPAGGASVTMKLPLARLAVAQGAADDARRANPDRRG
ncbi:two-component system, sensor histidine kinase RegB [Loktanella atrilutea]|uniref:histidine kinase n=1 Tax=Loktanella atrilutea TaxID=366533 RepID=A0A1M4SND1_LOKAT|nr:ATP-binding protein [Loktanella atrilutea]SHE33696.1 two-component system, sensor histidine kinase RegB [Loktanella atrilutea]